MHSHYRDARRFDRKVLAALAFGVALLALVLMLAHASIRHLQQTSSLARANEEFRRQLDAVAQTLLNMETGQRGYFLTGSVEYLEPYETGRRQIAGQISGLQRLMTDNRVQHENVTALTMLLEKRLGQMEHALALHRTQDVAAAMEFVRTNQGHTTMGQIRELVQRMSAVEERVLTERRDSETVALQRNFWCTATLSALAVALLIVIYLLVRRETTASAHTAEELEARVRESTRHLSKANESLQAEIEQRKQAERELKRSHDQLEERVRERTAELVEASAARARLLSAASHDLRQPLQSLILLNASLREQDLKPFSARIVETQQQSLEGMSGLVHALLNISRLQSGAVKPEIRDFTLGDMLRALHTEFAPLARAKHIALHIDEAPLAVRSDPTLLREIVQNLLANAVRYTEQGEVRLRTSASADHARIDVSDTGPGIPEDKRELIFEEFQQLKPRDHQRREGFGLGLAIVRYAARALGIQIELTSVVDSGTTFSITVPLGEAIAPALARKQQVPENAPSAAVGRILLVDDEPSVRHATALFLTVSGHDVVTAGSPAEALQILKEGSAPDVIISDYHLSASENGADLVQAIREELERVVPAVILTGDTTRLSRVCTSLENCRIFHKPVDAQALADYLQSVLSHDVVLGSRARAL